MQRGENHFDAFQQCIPAMLVGLSSFSFFLLARELRSTSPEFDALVLTAVFWTKGPVSLREMSSCHVSFVEPPEGC